MLLLAAGNSSRMGFPKQLLKWKNTNILQHAINTVNEIITGDKILVLGANFEKIKSNINTSETNVLYNENWKKGLGNSIAFGVNFLKKNFPNTESVLILLADQPLIDVNYLKLILKSHNQNSNKITCTTYDNGKFGVPAIFNKIYFEELEQLNNDTGAKVLLKKYSSEVIALDGIKIVRDIDTIEEYDELYKEFH